MSRPPARIRSRTAAAFYHGQVAATRVRRRRRARSALTSSRVERWKRGPGFSDRAETDDVDRGVERTTVPPCSARLLLHARRLDNRDDRGSSSAVVGRNHDSRRRNSLDRTHSLYPTIRRCYPRLRRKRGTPRAGGRRRAPGGRPGGNREHLREVEAIRTPDLAAFDGG